MGASLSDSTTAKAAQIPFGDALQGVIQITARRSGLRIHGDSESQLLIDSGSCTTGLCVLGLGRPWLTLRAIMTALARLLPSMS
jgi:hypothetical protein